MECPGDGALLTRSTPNDSFDQAFDSPIGAVCCMRSWPCLAKCSSTRCKPDQCAASPLPGGVSPSCGRHDHYHQHSGGQASRRATDECPAGTAACAPGVSIHAAGTHATSCAGSDAALIGRSLGQLSGSRSGRRHRRRHRARRSLHSASAAIFGPAHVCIRPRQ